MKAQLVYLKDSYQMNFIAIKISDETVSTYLNQMKEQVGELFEILTQNQKKKSLNNYYVNVITSTEYNELLKMKGIDKVVNTMHEFFEKILDVTLLGLGKAVNKQNEEYFVVVKSDNLNQIRDFWGLKKKDFTITLGFYPAEVHGVRKNEVMPLRDPFINLLSKSYYDSDKSFNFLKNLEFFDYDSEKQIDAIKIEDTYATFRVEQNYFTVSLIGDNLRISAKWNETLNKPKLSDTIISRKLKNF
jgi:hypothetical protein